LPALNQKYGAPNVTTQEVSNAFGAKLTNKIYTWELNGMRIVVSKYAGIIQKSGIAITNPKLN
jgi:hypothetical protein